MTALHRAAWHPFEQIVKILIEHGSNVDLQTTVLIFFFLFHFDFYFLLFFFEQLLFVKAWIDRSSHRCFLWL